MQNCITELFNIEYPIIQAGMIWNSVKFAPKVQDSGLYLIFENPQAAITEGQFASWYEGSELLGSGVFLKLILWQMFYIFFKPTKNKQ